MRLRGRAHLLPQWRQHLGPPLVQEALEHQRLVGRLFVDEVLVAPLCRVHPRPIAAPGGDRVRLQGVHLRDVVGEWVREHTTRLLAGVAECVVAGEDAVARRAGRSDHDHFSETVVSTCLSTVTRIRYPDVCGGLRRLVLYLLCWHHHLSQRPCWGPIPNLVRTDLRGRMRRLGTVGFQNGFLLQASSSCISHLELISEIVTRREELSNLQEVRRSLVRDAGLSALVLAGSVLRWLAGVVGIVISALRWLVL